MNTLIQDFRPDTVAQDSNWSQERMGNGKGKIQGKKVRSWPLGKCEGAVADDETGTLFIAEEKLGAWKFAKSAPYMGNSPDT